MSGIQEAVTAFFRETLKIAVQATDENLVEQGRLDSLGVVELLFFLEQRFGITVDLANLELDQLSSIDAICRLVAESGGGRQTRNVMSTTAHLTIERVNPLEHERSIKALFAQEGEAGGFFAPFFDRAYKQAVAEGAWSWIGRDEAGVVVMHMACFPQRFRFGHSVLTGGLGVNLMVARPHRSLLPALSLVRRLVADTRALGFDFLFADPDPPAARAVLKTAGFKVLGQWQRYALPLSGRTPLESAAVLGFRMWDLIRRRVPRIQVGHWEAAEFDEAAWGEPTPTEEVVVPIHGRVLYQRRLLRYPSSADHWFTDSDNAPASSVAVLVRMTEGIATIWAIRRRDSKDASAVVANVAAILRRMGAARLQAWGLVESSLDDELRASGLLRRGGTIPLLMLGLSNGGIAVAQRPQIWQLTQLDCDRGG